MSGFIAAGLAPLAQITGLGIDAFQLIYELSPIMFVNGLAGQMPGAAIPVISFTETENFVLGLLSGIQSLSLDNFFAHFQPLPGSTLLDLEIGTYPFANQAVAANATISKPLTLSYRMLCPSRNVAGYWSKGDILTGLQQAVTQHAALGGTYTCATPATFYTNGILTGLRDVSDPSTQVQNAYQWDFTFPLLTLQQAQSAQNSLMGKLSAGTMIPGAPSWSGGAASIGDSGSLAAPSAIPSAGSLPAISPASGPFLS
jgi:hypothetical protein